LGIEPHPVCHVRLWLILARVNPLVANGTVALHWLTAKKEAAVATPAAPEKTCSFVVPFTLTLNE
jgi:hypothetical protein